MSTTTVNIAFQSELLREIDRVATAEARSRSEFVREAARAYIERKKRWDALCEMGDSIAAARNLSEDDLAHEIVAYRKNKTAKS